MKKEKYKKKRKKNKNRRILERKDKITGNKKK